MNKQRAILAFAIVIILLSCQLAAKGKKYEHPAFSFDYPSSWQLMSELFPAHQFGGDYYALGVQEIVMMTSVQKQGELGAYFAVASAPLPEGLDLESMYRQTYEQISDELREVSEQNVTVFSDPGYSITYQRPWGEPWWQFYDIWLEKEGNVYVLSFHALPGSFNDFHEDQINILNSFVLK